MDNWELLGLLTRFVDGQLSPEEQRRAETILAERPQTAALLERLERATRAVAEAVYEARPPAAAVVGPDCLSDELLSRLADDALTPPQRRAAEAHLLSCDRCLLSVLEVVRSATSMQRGRWPELPPDVGREKVVEALVNLQEPEARDEEWQTLEFCLSQEGETRHSLRAGSLTVQLKATSRGSAMRLDLALRDAERGVRGRGISLSSNETGRKHLSGETDSKGRFSVSRLRPGEYTLHFFGSTLKVELHVSEG